jgi:hypothetical protein
MNYHLGKLKLDSLAIVIPTEKCNNHSTAGRKDLSLRDDEGVEYARGMKVPMKPLDDAGRKTAKGITYRGELRHRFNGRIKDGKGAWIDAPTTEVFRIVINAKMLLSERYFEGITMDNIKIVWNYLQSLNNGIYFTYEEMLNAQVEDVDFCYDIEATPKEWEENIRYIESRVRIDRSKHFHKILKKDENISCWFMDRVRQDHGKNASPTAPHLKYYHKGLELFKEDNKEWLSNWVGKRPDDVANVGRYELTLSNSRWWKKAGLSTPKSLIDLLGMLPPTMPDTLTNYIMEATKQYFLASNVVQKRTKKFDESLTEAWWLDILEQLIQHAPFTKEDSLNILINRAKDRGTDPREVRRVKDKIEGYWKRVTDVPAVSEKALRNKALKKLIKELRLE